MMHRMPTQNPRITITLTPSTHSLLRELSSLTGNSMSSTLAELLAGNEPVFQRMVTVLRAAKEVQEEGRASMLEALTKAQARVEEQLGLALEAMDDGSRPLLDKAEEVRRRGRKGAPLAGVAAARDGVPTPPSNRGVRSTANPGKTTRKGS
jgi:multidrug efflux pump subunit AcrA (membrane-fusion protein)